MTDLPSTAATAFGCLHCGAYARQKWWKAHRQEVFPETPPALGPKKFRGGFVPVEDLWLAICDRCGGMSVWCKNHLIDPDRSTAPAANPDLPDDIRPDYEEARRIADRSPRGAAALLRLCVQKLCKHLGEPGKNINQDVASLVKRGLPVQVQQALDIVRVTGNNAVHPGQIDLKDEEKTVERLFELVNLVTQTMITQPKAIQEMYDKLPQSALDGIAKRDGGSS